MVIGTLALAAGCEKEPEERVELSQEFYASRDDCEKDWGPEPDHCTQTSELANFDDTRSGASSRSSTYMYAGPRYYWDRSAGHPIAVMPSGQTKAITGSHLSRGTGSTARGLTVSSVTRGGFGSSARGSSTSGG